MNSTKAQRIFLSSSLSVFLAGCGAPNYSQSEMHITFEEAEATKQVKPEKIPALVKASPTAPVLSNNEDSSTFDVVVSNVPVNDLLFALARDAGVNMDIDDNVGGYVSISALDQTLEAILARVAEQVEIRITRVGDAIVVKPDTHYHKHYQVEFLNIVRSYSSSATAGGVGDTGSADISSSAQNNFWGGLEQSISQILAVGYIQDSDFTSASIERRRKGEEEDAALDVQESEFKLDNENTSSFNLNPETGVLVVYAPDRLQREVQALLDRMLSIAKRQVLLEATIVEVVLNNQYEQGIDWSLFNSLATEGLALYQGGVAGGAAAGLEYITREFERSFGDIDFNGNTYQAADADQLERLGLSKSEAARVAALTTGSVRGNEAARVLRNNYLADIRRQTFSNPRNVVNEFETTTEISDVDDAGFLTYTGGGSYTREEINDQATARSSGGLVPNNPLNDNFFSLAYRKGDISAAVQLLDTFGDAKVLSSPRISALNYQPALLRVVDQEVYFTFTVEEEVNDETGLVSSREYTAEENTVDVGFSMNVLPHISENGEVILNLKPTVTRVLDYRRGPVLEAFGEAAGGTQNLVPITRVRELESIISLRDGEIAVLGGLLEDRTGDNNSSVPGLSSLPGVGTLFEKKSETTYKTEFVVFIRARVITNPSINGDYSDYRHLLPNTDFILRDTGSTLLPPSQEQAR